MSKYQRHVLSLAVTARIKVIPTKLYKTRNFFADNIGFLVSHRIDKNYPSPALIRLLINSDFLKKEVFDIKC